MRTSTLLIAVAAASFGLGCSPFFAPFDRACTLIGCENGLAVELDRLPSSPYRVELVVSEGGPRYEYECPDPARCGPRVFFTGFTADYVRVRVTTSAGTVTHEARPTYAVHRPNGDDCPPECRQATVRVSIPG